MNFFEHFFKGLNQGIKMTESKIDDLGRKVNYKIERFRKRILLGSIQVLFILAGAAFIILGAVLFFTLFFPLYAVLLVMGVLLLYLAMITGWKK
jgi:hypothetical protein